MKEYKRLNLITGWLTFLISAIVYTLTIEPSASFWDCGEFISASFKLLVGHPPGAPFFMIVGRFFSLFAINPQQVSVMLNLMSAFASAFTILFLFWSITHLARKIFIAPDQEDAGQDKKKKRSLSFNLRKSSDGSCLVLCVGYVWSYGSS